MFVIWAKYLVILVIFFFKVIQLLCGTVEFKSKTSDSKAEILNLYCNTASAFFILFQILSFYYLSIILSIHTFITSLKSFFL